jgi:hypothetical protein
MIVNTDVFDISLFFLIIHTGQNAKANTMCHATRRTTRRMSAAPKTPNASWACAGRHPVAREKVAEDLRVGRAQPLRHSRAFGVVGTALSKKTSL